MENEMPATVNFDGFIPYTHECGGAKNFFNEPICKRQNYFLATGEDRFEATGHAK